MNKNDKEILDYIEQGSLVYKNNKFYYNNRARIIYNNSIFIRNKYYSLNRVLWLFFLDKEIPEGMKVINFNSNPSKCPRIEDLKAVPHKEALEWMRANVIHGEKSGLNKLNIKQVKKIKKLLKDGLNQNQIIKTLKLNVKQPIISKIKNGKLWRNINV